MLRALGSPGVLAGWQPEYVPDAREGTNIDIYWWTEDGAKTICEVKLSETDFGKAPDDRRHRDKLPLYREKLSSHLLPPCLERRAFLDAYQFYRNIYHMVCGDRTRLVFLLPKANTILQRRLKELLKGIMPSARLRISAISIEDLITTLSVDNECPAEMREYATKLEAKYVLTSSQNS